MRSTRDAAAAARASVRRHLEQLSEVAIATERVADDVARLARLVIETFESGRKLMFCGNGGSAADAQHLATEYVVRFRRNRRSLPAIALTTDTSLLTAAANDLGFERVFARQVEALGRSGDVLFLHTTSGESKNLLMAANAAKEAGVTTVGMLARDGGALRHIVDHAVIVPTDSGAHAQELHLALGHAICTIVEAHFAGGDQGELEPGTIARLHEARLAEKRQALFYRALAAAAEEAEDDQLSERLNGLHADEQHHLSRLTVRLVELGEAVADLGAERAAEVSLEAWEAAARAREQEEVLRYEQLLECGMDEKTRHMLTEFAAAERAHAEALGGKWMGAEPW